MGILKKTFGFVNPVNYGIAKAGKAGAGAIWGTDSNGRPIVVDNSGRPNTPAWESQLDDEGKIQENLRLENKIDPRFLEQMREDSLRQPGEASAWRGLVDDKITRQAGDSAQQLSGAQQQALDQMAMRGGVSAGAKERMMQAGVGQNLANQQNIFGNRLQADLQDEQMRQQGLLNLGEAEMQFGGQQNLIDAENVGSTKQEIFQKRAFDTNAYNEQMRAWAAGKTANAIPSSSGKK